MFARRDWCENDFHRWYGLDFGDLDTKRILVRAGWYAGDEENPSTLGAGPFSHWHVETYFQRSELVPLNFAAAQLALLPGDFRRVVDNLRNKEEFPTLGNPWVSKSIVRRNYLRDFHKGFKSGRRIIFRDQPAYIDFVHREIQRIMDEVITCTQCPTSRVLGEHPIRPGHTIDCLTEEPEPIGIGHAVFLDTRKPIQLAPDVCSWLTYAQFEEVLRDHVISLPPRLTPAIIEQLRGTHD